MSAVHIRWMIRRDFPSVLEIEKNSFDDPWEKDDFLWYLQQRSYIGQVAERDELVVGYKIYKIGDDRMELVNLAVDPMHRLSGVGRAMLDKMKLRLSAHRRRMLTLHIRETNLDAQLFFRSCGFRATGVVRGLYEGREEDAYCFQFHHSDAPTHPIG